MAQYKSQPLKNPSKSTPCPQCGRVIGNAGYINHMHQCARKLGLDIQINVTQRAWEIIQTMLYRELNDPHDFNKYPEFKPPTFEELDDLCDKMMIAIGWDGIKVSNLDETTIAEIIDQSKTEH